MGLTKSSICSKNGKCESLTSGWTGTPVVSEFIDGLGCCCGITGRGWGGGTTTFPGPHRLSYNSLNFLLTVWFPSLFNIWSALPISSCFLPVFDLPAKPNSDWSSETRKLINMCCRHKWEIWNFKRRRILWIYHRKIKIFLLLFTRSSAVSSMSKFFFEIPKPRTKPLEKLCNMLWRHKNNQQLVPHPLGMMFFLR